MAALFGLFVKEVGSPIISHWSVVNKTRFGSSNVLFQKGLFSIEYLHIKL